MFVQEVLLRLPLKTSPNDPFPIRSCFSNRTSGSPLDMVICVCKLIEWFGVFLFLGIELDIIQQLPMVSSVASSYSEESI